MPSFTRGRHKVKVHFASEERLLAFANELRAGGDAAPLESLMPSIQSNSEACLIANAVNYGSAVQPTSAYNEETCSWTWEMRFPKNMETSRIEKIAKKVNCETITRVGQFFHPLALVLPQDIGNTADAFDNDEGWTTKYADPAD